MTEGRCSCTVDSAMVTSDGHKPGKCPNALTDPRNALCRPCAKPWHRTKPCDRHVPETVRHLVKTCARCGFDSAAHPMPPELR